MTVTDREILLAPAVAVMVMVFAPTASGTLGMVQAEAEPVAVPEAAPVDQVTVIVPEPPEAEPDTLIADADVVDGGTVTVSVRGAVGIGGMGGLGGTGGGGGFGRIRRSGGRGGIYWCRRILRGVKRQHRGCVSGRQRGDNL